MSEAKAGSTGGGTPLWVRIVLGLSLAVNLLILGVVLGATLGGRGGDRAVRDPGAMPFVRALEPEDRRALLRQMRREGDGWQRTARAEMRARRATLLEALRADVLDRAAVEEVLNAQAAQGDVRRALGQKVLLDHLESLSASERRAYADRLEQALDAPRRP